MPPTLVRVTHRHEYQMRQPEYINEQGWILNVYLYVDSTDGWNVVSHKHFRHIKSCLPLRSSLQFGRLLSLETVSSYSIHVLSAKSLKYVTFPMFTAPFSAAKRNRKRMARNLWRGAFQYTNRNSWVGTKMSATASARMRTKWRANSPGLLRSAKKSSINKNPSTRRLKVIVSKTKYLVNFCNTNFVQLTLHSRQCARVRKYIQEYLREDHWKFKKSF